MEETLYTDELVHTFSESGITEDLQELKFGHPYSVVWKEKQATLTIEGISYGAFEDLYTVLIEEKE